MDKTLLRLCESNLLRAEAALERHNAKNWRRENRDGFGFEQNDSEADELHARVHDAKADLLEAQAEYVLHGDDQTPTPEAEEATP